MDSSIRRNSNIGSSNQANVGNQAVVDNLNERLENMKNARDCAVDMQENTMNELDKLDLFDSNTVFNAESRNKIYSLFVKIYIP